MLKSMRVIAIDMKKICLTTFLNAVHLILKGAPFGILFLLIMELLQPKEKINVPLLIGMTGGMASIMLANLFLAMKVHVLAYVTSFDLAAKARLNLGDHLRKLSLGFFKKRDTGDISALLLQDMARVEMIFSHFFIDAIACIILPVMMACFFFLSDGRMATLMAVSVIIAIPVLMAAQKFIAFFGRKHVHTRNRTTSGLLEYLQGIKVLKAFNLTGGKFSRLDRAMRELCADSIRLEAAGGGPVLLYMTILELGFIGLLIFGTHLLLKGDLAVPVLLLFLVIGYKFFEPLMNFGVFLSQMRYLNLAAGRISHVMENPPLKEPDDPAYPDTFHITFKNVTFAYTDTPILSSFNAEFPEKSITALVGPSGSGKTTITSLIPRFWDVNAGSISIGGVDIRQIPAETLNGLISVVFQDVYLFHDTVFNNIRVGKKEARPDEVIKAAKMAQCHDFIEQMESGYETVIGEGGSTLSGGERQRLSIARALLKDAPIIILDEATASLDPENELLVQKAIGELVTSKTLIVIAHRLKTIAKAGQILVIDRGTIVEKGKHNELLASNGLYFRLWNEQQKAGGWKFRQ
jgi:ATP-binding cassette subfamily B protein IrtB